MALNNPYETYQQNSIMTARPEELTLMLYNGAIKSLKQAKIAFAEKNIQNINNNITKAEDIMSELKCTLNMDYGVSESLYALYDFMFNWLAQANLTKFEGGEKKVDDVVNLLEDLRDTWSEAMKIAKNTQRSGA